MQTVAENIYLYFYFMNILHFSVFGVNINVLNISETLAKRDIKELPEVIQSEMGQKQKLQRVLNLINDILKVHPTLQKWTVDSKFCSV